MKYSSRVTERPGITGEAIERLRQRIGVPHPHTAPPHYRVVTTDVFRHVANAYGAARPRRR